MKKLFILTVSLLTTLCVANPKILLKSKPKKHGKITVIYSARPGGAFTRETGGTSFGSGFDASETTKDAIKAIALAKRLSK